MNNVLTRLTYVTTDMTTSQSETISRPSARASSRDVIAIAIVHGDSDDSNKYSPRNCGIDPGLQVHLEFDFHLQLNDWRRPESPDKEET